MTPDPPLLAGAVQERAVVPLPGVATSPVGAAATVAAGMIEFEGPDAMPVPSEFVAVTVNA